MDMNMQQKDFFILEYIRIIGPKKVLLLLFACFSLRLVLFVFFQPWSPKVEALYVLRSDAIGYHQLATELLENHGFTAVNTGEPEALRTPVYPMFIATVYSLFGYKPWVVMLFQIFLDTATCLLLLISFSHLFDKRMAIIAATFYAFEPFLILYSATMLWSDTLFEFFLLLAFYFFSINHYNKFTQSTLINYGLVGLFLGFATLTRPIAQFIIVCFCAFLVFMNWKKRRKAALSCSLIIFIVWGLTLLPWLVRNYNTFGYFYLSTSDSYNMLILNVTPMEMVKRHEDTRTVEKDLLAEADALIEADGFTPLQLNAFQKAKYWRDLAIKYISSDPIAFTKHYFGGIFDMFFNLGTRSYFDVLGFPSVNFEIKAYTNIFDLVRAYVEKKGLAGIVIGSIIGLYFIVTYIGAIVGLFVAWKRYTDWQSLLMVLLLMLYFILITGTAGLVRFKLPAIPFYLAFTGAGFCYLYEIFSQQWQKLKLQPTHR